MEISGEQIQAERFHRVLVAARRCSRRIAHPFSLGSSHCLSKASVPAVSFKRAIAPVLER